MSKKTPATPPPPTVLVITLESDGNGSLLTRRGEVAHLSQFAYRGLQDLITAIQSGAACLVEIEANLPAVQREAPPPAPSADSQTPPPTPSAPPEASPVVAAAPAVAVSAAAAPPREIAPAMADPFAPKTPPVKLF